MKPGRKPKPTHLKLITGNPGRRKLNEREPKPQLVVPEPPAHLDAEARAEWDRAAPELHALGVLSRMDRAVFAEYCVHWSRWVQAERLLRLMADKDDIGKGLVIKTKNENWIQNPVVGVANTASRELLRCAEQLGMTPSARSRIDTNKLPSGDDAEKFFG